MTYHVLRDRLLVQLEPLKEQTKSGLYIHQSEFPQIRYAHVLGCGYQVKQILVGCRIVLANGYVGTCLDEDKEIRVIGEGDVIAVVDGETDEEA